MSMAEYMCKLFYGRRGIKLNEEQFSILFPNSNSNYFTLGLPPAPYNQTDSNLNASSSEAKISCIETPCGMERFEQITSSYGFSHNTSFPSVYTPFQMSSLNFTKTSTPSNDFYNPYLSYLSNNTYPTYNDNLSVNRLRYNDIEISLISNPLSDQNYNVNKDENKKEIDTKTHDLHPQTIQTSLEYTPKELIRCESDSSKSLDNDPQMQSDCTVKWNAQNTLSFKPIQPDQFNYNSDWNVCNFQKDDSKHTDLNKAGISGLKKECFYLSYPPSLSLNDPMAMDKMNKPFEMMPSNVDSFVGSLSLDLDCDACRRPQFNLLQKPSHLNTLPANYPSVFSSNPYQFNHFPSCAKDFSSKNSCLMNNRLEMDVSCKLKSLQHVCAVCGDHAACQHYGVRTCEGCKGFFKRTVQKGAVYVCLSGKNCPIDKRRRNRCQYCRFEKCLSVGMVKEVVRTDMLKGRRGRLPSKPKTMTSIRDASISPPASFVTSLVRAYVNSEPDPQSLDYTQYRGPILSASNGEELDSSYTDLVFYNFLCSLLEACIKISVEWSTSLPGFDSLCHHDQQLLFHASLLELIILRIAFKFDENKNSVTFCNGSVLDYTFYSKHASFSWLHHVVEFSKSFKCLQDFQIDLSTFCCLLALTMITHRTGVEKLKSIDSLQSLISDALYKHHHNQAFKPSFLPTALSKLIELRTCANRVLNEFKEIIKFYQTLSSGESILEKLIYFSNFYN